MGSDMRNEFKPFKMVMSPSLPMHLGVLHYADGILARAYPAPADENEPRAAGAPPWFASKASRLKYGQDLFITLENIYRECLTTGKESSVQVTWRDGKPEVKVTKRHVIIAPGVN